jgi:hypothetical protein
MRGLTELEEHHNFEAIKKFYREDLCRGYHLSLPVVRQFRLFYPPSSYLIPQKRCTVNANVYAKICAGI